MSEIDRSEQPLFVAAICIVFVIPILAFLGSMVIGKEWKNGAHCASISKKLDRPTGYTRFGECYIKHNGRWITEERYRKEETAK